MSLAAGAINLSLSIYLQPTDEALLLERTKQYAGPYRAYSAYKGDEEKGERDLPWIVVGSSGVNCFGRLWPKAYALAVAAAMNKISGDL